MHVLIMAVAHGSSSDVRCDALPVDTVSRSDTYDVRRCP